MPLTIDSQLLSNEIDELAAISDAEAPAVTRVVFTPTDMKARAWLRGRCEAADWRCAWTRLGTPSRVGQVPTASAPVVGTGSHIDAIPNAGKYDGVVGVLGGLEAIRALQRDGFRPRNSIELLLLTSEEPTRFGIGCIGSRMLSGSFPAEAARKLKDKDDASVDEVRRAAGMQGDLEHVPLARGYYKAWVELHIEQGPLLERDGVPLGIVTRIAAPASARITIEGSGGHAGGVVMPDRRDALCAASELILAIENAARTTGSIDSVATVGICDVFPSAVNSIPSRVRLSLDVRDTDLARRDGVKQAIERGSKEIAARRKVSIVTELLNADAPADCAPQVIDALSRAAEKHNIASQRMISRAYHDSLFIARIAPVAMLFIPCRNGYSHRPDEYAAPEDIARGTLVLAETLASLAS